ncbi:MAG: O-antigen ligase family protein [Candidatus Methylomirabilales bacterium]
MRKSLAEKFSGFLRADPTIASPGPGGAFRCRAFDIGLGVLIAAVPLAFYPIAPASLKWAILGVLTPLVTFLWLWGGCGGPFRPLPKLVAPLLTLLLVSGLSLLQTTNLYYGLQRIASFLVLFLLYLTVAYTCSQPDRQAILMRYLVLTLLVVSIFSLYRCTMGCPVPSIAPVKVLFRLFGNTNYGAAYLLTVIPLSLALFLDASPRWEKALWGTALFLPMALLTLSMVRGAWVSIWIGLLVLVRVFFRRERSLDTFQTAPRMPQIRALLLLGSAVLVAYALWPVCLSGLSSFGKHVASIFNPEAASLKVRLDWWQATLRMITDHLWAGVGIGNFTFAYVPYRSAFSYRNPGMRLEHPHNEYLNFWAELGPLGLLALLWLAVRIVRLGWHLAKERDGGKGVLAGVLGGLAASAAYANLFYVVHAAASAMNVAILLGILDGMNRKAGQEERGKPIRLAYLLPGLVVMCLLSFQYFVRPLAGEVYYFRAAMDFQDKQMEAGLSQLERSLEWNPQSFEARYRRASVLLNKMGRNEEAIQAAEEALKIHPNMELAYDVMGKAYLNLGDKSKAKESFLQAAALNVNYPHALISLGVIAALEGRIRQAEALFLRTKEILGRSEMSVYANLGNVYEMTGRTREALRMYETAVAITPKFGSNWYTVARLRVLNDDPAGAYAPLARAIALDEGWRANAAQAKVFEGVRQEDPRVRVLLRLD